MAKKKRGRKMPKWKKYVRAGMGIAGTILGVAIATAPTHRGIEQLVKGEFVTGIDSIVFDTTGMIPSAGAYAPDVTKLIGVGITVGVGIGIMKLFKFLGRRV